MRLIKGGEGGYKMYRFVSTVSDLIETIQGDDPDQEEGN